MKPNIKVKAYEEIKTHFLLLKPEKIKKTGQQGQLLSDFSLHYLQGNNKEYSQMYGKK
jgi:hypothetical protein